MSLLCLGSLGTINTCGDLPQVFDESTKKKLCVGGLLNPIGLLSTRIPSQAIVRANRKVKAQSGANVQHWGSYNRYMYCS